MTRHTLRHMARAPRRTAPQSPAAPAPTGMPPTEGAATPRSNRGAGPSQVAWEGCALVEVDPKNPKYIPANASVVLKVELKGWMDIGDDVQECRLGQRVPLEVIANLEFTRDDLHRRYGPGYYFVHAYVAGDGEKGTTLGTPIMGQTHEIAPCDFDNAKDSDPEDEEDDVGTQAWRVPPSATIANPELKEEIARRREVRRELGIGEEKRGAERDRGRGGRMSARGGRGNDRDRGRGGRGGREWGPDEDDRGRGFDDEPELPDEMLDPSWVPAPAPPGMVWAWDAYKAQWRQYPAGSAPAPTQPAAPVTPPAAPAFYETAQGATVITAAITALGAIVAKALEPKPAAPNPMDGLLTLWATMQSKAPDPLALKQLDIDAEQRRATAALEAENARIERENARIEAQRVAAEAQRAHDAKMEADRREAARIEAIAAEERAKQRAIESRNELITLQRLGLDPNAKPQRSEDEIRNAIKAEMLVEQLKKERDAALGTGDIAAQIKRAEAVLKAAGIDVSTEASKSMLMDFFNTKAGEVAVGTGLGIVDRLVNMFTAAKGGAPTPAAPGGSPTVQLTEQQLNDLIRQRQEEAFRVGVEQARIEQERAAQAAQAAWEAQQVGQVPGVPVPAEMPPAEPPPMGQWQAVPAPVEQTPEAQSEPTAETPADPAPEAPPPAAEVPVEAAPEVPGEVPPAAEDAPPPEAPPVEATPEPAPEAPAEGESDGQRSRRLRDAAPVEPHPVIDREPEALA